MRKDVWQVAKKRVDVPEIHIALYIDRAFTYPDHISPRGTSEDNTFDVALPTFAFRACSIFVDGKKGRREIFQIGTPNTPFRAARDAEMSEKWAMVYLPASPRSYVIPKIKERQDDVWKGLFFSLHPEISPIGDLPDEYWRITDITSRTWSKSVK